MDSFNTRLITLPDGFDIRARVVSYPEEMVHGMMFRESLAQDRGMLFIHGEPHPYTYWMFQVKIPLDIIWLDRFGRVLELSANTPPCTSEPDDCPHYGGHAPTTVMVLEVNAGICAKHNVRVGSKLRM